MNQERLLDFKTVCKRYNFKPWGLRHRIRLRQVPFVKLGRSIFFDPTDLEKWIQGHKIPIAKSGGKT